MPLKDREARNAYAANWKKEARRIKREALGLKKGARPPQTETQKEESSKNRSEWEKGWRQEYFKINPTKRMLYSAKKRAKEKNLPFNIEESDINIPEYCPYLGIKLTFHSPRGQSRQHGASLDRIFPDLGYVKGNVEVISHLANTMKNDASITELQNFALEILKRYPV